MRQALIQNAKVPDDANVRGEFGSLGIFGYDPQTLSITWEEVVGKLQKDEDERPWPGSAVAWTKMLGRTLRKAISRHQSFVRCLSCQQFTTLRSINNAC